MFYLNQKKLHFTIDFEMHGCSSFSSNDLSFLVALVAVFYRSMAQMSSVTVPVTLSKVGDQCMDILTSVKAGEMVRMTAKLSFSGPFMDYQDYFEIDGFESGFLGPKFDHDISSLIVVRIMLPEVEDQALLYLTIQGHFIEDFAIHTMAFSTRCHEDVLGGNTMYN